MKPTPQTKSAPPRLPGLYRLMAAMLGPLEKILGITCRDFTRLASEKLDRPLTSGEQRRYWFHGLICSICRRQEQRMRQINTLAGKVLTNASTDAAVTMEEESRLRLRQRLERELNSD